MSFGDAASKRGSRQARGHDSVTDAAKRRIAQTKAGKKVANGRETAARIGDRAKSAAGKEAPCANPKCSKKTKNGYVCSAKCAKAAGENF